jgi:hypothetical protein
MHRGGVRDGDRGMRRLSFLLAGLVIGHGLIYALAYGTSAGLARAMSQSGHDGYWTELAIAGLLAALGFLAFSAFQIGRLVRLWRLARRLAGQPSLRSSADGGVVPLATRRFLFFAPLLVLAYLGQENLEAVAAGLSPAGLGALCPGAGCDWAPLVLLGVAFLLAVLDATLDWSRGLLLQGIRAALGRRRPILRRPADRRELRPSLSLRGLRRGRAPPGALVAV